MAKGYTKVYNSWFDLGLSMDALGIFVYMSSKRKDWVFRSAEIRKTLGLSDHKWRSSTKELKKLGLYIITKTSKGTTISVGKLEESTTGRIPTSGSATSGSATRGIPTPLIRLNINKTDSNKTEVNNRSFSLFWSSYPKKIGRKKCSELWLKRNLHEKADLIIDDVARKALNDRQWLEGYIPNPQTYLNGDRWEDEVQHVNPSPSPQGKYKLNRDFLDTDDNVIEGVVVDRSIGSAP
jgi:hypothetical protein